MPSALTVSVLARMIDDTLLRPDATERDLGQHCSDAVERGVATVAINPAWVSFCADQLHNSRVGVCAAISLPLGQSTKSTKVYETREAIANGATEIDFVINVGALKSGRLTCVSDEIAAVVQACEGHPSKVILETCYLTNAEKRAVCLMAIEAGATFVKTSTGMAAGGATIPDVLLMGAVGVGRVQIKAAGGIRTLEQVLAFIGAGCSRIGTSRAAAILEEAKSFLPA